MRVTENRAGHKLFLHHQSNWQGEACIKIVKCTIKKCLDNNDDVNLALLQIRPIPIWAELPSSDTFLFNRQFTALLLQMNREPISFNANDEHYEAIKHAKISILRQ